MKEEIQFRLGDSVYFPYHGYGTIIGLHNDGREYPIEVRWEESPHGQEVNTFTKDGFLTHGLADRNVPSDSKLRDQLTVVDKSQLKKAERDIYPLKISSDLDEEAVDPMIETLDKKVDDAINPSHYRVKGLPETIDIMDHLMTKEQLEGFLWGNIIKYAYRYGRKGDKAETAGKIAWYANHLKDLEEEKRK